MIVFNDCEITSGESGAFTFVQSEHGIKFVASMHGKVLTQEPAFQFGPLFQYYSDLAAVVDDQYLGISTLSASLFRGSHAPELTLTHSANDAVTPPRSRRKEQCADVIAPSGLNLREEPRKEGTRNGDPLNVTQNLKILHPIELASVPDANEIVWVEVQSEDGRKGYVAAQEKGVMYLSPLEPC